MKATTQNNAPPTVKRYRPARTRGIMLVQEFHEFLAQFGPELGIELISDDIKSAKTTAEGGLRMRLRGSGGSSTSPLFVSQAGVVTPGTIAGVMPTIGGVALDAGAAALSFSGSGVEYVVANITGTHSITGGTFATNLTSRAVSITVETSSPGSAGITSIASGGTFKILVATFNNGLKTGQSLQGSITCNFYDDGSNSAKLNCEPLRL